MHTLKALVLLTIVNLVGCDAMTLTGRYQIVNTAPHPMLLDTATGATWTLCETASKATYDVTSTEWCAIRRTGVTVTDVAVSNAVDAKMKAMGVK